MVGRTPEYLGKKIGAREIKFASLYFLTTPALVLVGTAAAMAHRQQRRRAQRRPARALRGALRVHVGDATTTARRSPASRVNTTVVQHRARAVHAARAGSCRSSSCSAWPARWPAQKPVPASAGHAADPPAAVRRHGRRRRRDRRRADLPARARPRPAGRRPVTMQGRDDMSVTPRGTRPTRRPPVPRDRAAGRRRAAGPRSSCWQSTAGRAAQAQPAHAVAQPGDVHRRGRRGLHHRAGDRRPDACSPG